MIPLTELPDGGLFTVSGFSTVYRRISASEIRIHGLPPNSWLSKQRITPIPNLFVQPVDRDSTRVEVEQTPPVEKVKPTLDKENVTAVHETTKKRIPKRAAKRRSIPKRKEK